MKKNIFLEILKILGAIIAGGFLWLIIFSFALPAAEDGSCLLYTSDAADE